MKITPFFKLRLDLSSPNTVTMKQSIYNLVFLMLLIFGIGAGIIISVIFFGIIPSVDENNYPMLFGAPILTFWLIIHGVLEIRESLNPIDEYEVRKKNVIQTCGCVCFCPSCNDILNDQADYSELENGAGKYVCNNCGNISIWEFDIAPVPICIDEFYMDEKKKN